MEDAADPRKIARLREKRLAELQRRMTIVKTGDHPLEVTDMNFNEVIDGEGLVIVDCWAPWCGPCRMMGPIIDQAAKDYTGKVTFGTLNVDDNGATAMKLRIMSIPTILFYKEGQVVERITGAIPREQLDKLIKKHIK